MKSVDVTLKIARDGAAWFEHHWLVEAAIDDMDCGIRIVSIEDGSEDPRPMIVWVSPDRPKASSDGVLL